MLSRSPIRLYQPVFHKNKATVRNFGDHTVEKMSLPCAGRGEQHMQLVPHVGTETCYVTTELPDLGSSRGIPLSSTLLLLMHHTFALAPVEGKWCSHCFTCRKW